MKYYRLNFTLNPKLRGNDNYIKEYKLKIPGNNSFWDEPKFIGNIQNKKIDFSPYLLDVEIFENSIPNDYILDGGPISGKPILSTKLKCILESKRNSGMQFFNINLIKKKSILDNFWILNMYETNQEFIDFKNSKIIYHEKADDFETSFLINDKVISLDTLEDFKNLLIKAKENLEVITIENIALHNVREDYFALQYVNGGIGYFVSEKLKEEIEIAGCKGIEFQPSELSFDEWVVSGGEREKVYGKSY